MNSLAALRQFVSVAPAQHRCDSCGAGLPAQHSHSLEILTRRILCLCSVCTLKFADTYKPVPHNPKTIALQISDSQWSALGIPVSLAFVYRSTAAGHYLASYPSPTGIIENPLTGDAWQQLCLANPDLLTLQDDVEALLLNRTAPTHEYFIAPIDECFSLGGILRRHWRGFSGGPAIWGEIALFFAELRRRAARAGADFARVEKIADAVLYEGFLLYPYRKSALKNQRRWHFGTIEPGGVMQTECLVAGGLANSLEIKIRFLQDEIPRQIHLTGVPLNCRQLRRQTSFGNLLSTIETTGTLLREGLFRFTVRILNESSRSETGCNMLSTHTLLAIRDGAFISLIDPGEEFSGEAEVCRNIGTWPVLAGAEGDRTLMLSSPVILYDYPQVAPESAGNFFDGTEIDELLSLRILTLSDKEKSELEATGGEALNILKRTQSLPPEAFAKMHGAIRSLKSAAPSLQPGDRVLLRPRKRSDIFDLSLNGKIAIVESVERDFEDKIHLAVTLEDDPGRDLGVAGYMGHRFFFAPEEVQRL